MEVNMNNIRLFHQGGDYLKDKRSEISIAQHTVDGNATTQEILVWDVDFEEDIIIHYSDSISSLIRALEEAKTIIEKRRK